MVIVLNVNTIAHHGHDLGATGLFKGVVLILVMYGFRVSWLQSHKLFGDKSFGESIVSARSKVPFPLVRE